MKLRIVSLLLVVCMIGLVTGCAKKAEQTANRAAEIQTELTKLSTEMGDKIQASPADAATIQAEYQPKLDALTKEAQELAADAQQ